MIKYSGLTQEKAKLALEEFGLNEIAEQKRYHAAEIFLRQFHNFLVYLLFFASFFSFLLGELVDGVFILLIIILNAILGFIQEYRAENALKELKKIAVSEVQVIRDGKDMLMDSRFLVPEDIIKVSEGSRIPADAKILESLHLELNEASLTGESLPIAKSETDKKNNSLFMGTVISSGRAIAKVIATGKNTRFGKMAKSLSEITDEETPLSKKITSLGKTLSLIVIIITFFIFLLGLVLKLPFAETILTSISLAVAAVPEGLPAVITITLAVGLQRMAKKKAGLRKLGAIEALGNVNIIVTDKTGTLTENKMQITKVWLPDGDLLTENLSLKNLSDANFWNLLKTGIICNNAMLVYEDKKSKPEILGDQTEGSLLLLAQKLGVEPEKVLGEGKIIDEFSFSSEKKLMSVAWSEKGKNTLFTKGAPEAVLDLSTHIFENGKSVLLDFKRRKQIHASFSRFASSGLRILALAQKNIKTLTKQREDYEKTLTFVGFVGISDPPREEVAATLRIAKQAGIRTIMVTGDNPLTAVNVGKKVGLIGLNPEVLVGGDIQKLNNHELANKLRSVSIIARAVPEDKLRIVKLLQAQKNIVAVTGDGVNDALALKQADIGVAMGITGSDVAKEVADMIITDDNFVSMVSAVREGRIIFSNIVKSVIYLVSCNLGEILTITGAMIYNVIGTVFFNLSYGLLPLPLLPIHILWINIVTDGLPALSLAFDPGSDSIMAQRNKRTQIIEVRDFRFLIISAGFIASTTLIFFALTLNSSSLNLARTVAFNTLVILQMIMVFIVRGKQKIFSNKLLIFSVILALLLQFLITTLPPLSTIFKLR